MGASTSEIQLDTDQDVLLDRAKTALITLRNMDAEDLVEMLGLQSYISNDEVTS